MPATTTRSPAPPSVRRALTRRRVRVPTGTGSRTAALAAVALGLSVAALAPAGAAETSWRPQPGWPATTDLRSARPMNVPIEGSTGTSGWFKHSSPTLADLDRDGRLEVVTGSLDGRVYVHDDNGTSLWNRYLDAYTTPAGPVNGSPAVGDIDADGTIDVVAGSDNGWVFAWDAGGNLKPGWPQFTGWNADYPARCATNACTGVFGSPTLADLDGDRRLEVIAGSFSHLMYVWRADGSVMPGWPRDVWDGIASGAAVGDINADGHPEIVVGSDVESDCADCPPFGRLSAGGLVHAFTVNGDELPGWPYRTSSFQHSTPVLADLDGDRHLEVVVGGGFFVREHTTRGHELQVIRSDGRLAWSHRLAGVVLGPAAVGDVTGDGRPEIAVGDVSCLGGACSTITGTVLLSGNGTRLWANTGVTTSSPNGSGAHFGGPVLADVTGDGRPEVVTTDGNWHVKAIDVPTGRTVADTATTFPIFASAAVGDVDGDGTNEVVVGSAVGNGPGPTLEQLAGAGRIHVFDTPGRGGLVFPQYQSRVVARPLPPPCVAAAAPVTDLPMVVRRGFWHGRAGYSAGGTDTCYQFGDPTDLPVTGDWDGDGDRTPGVFRPSTGTWYLNDGGGAAISRVGFASPGDVPVSGDWDGDGRDDIGVFRSATGTWYLTTPDSPRTVAAVAFASPGDVPVTGDWNGDNRDDLGVYRSGRWYQRTATSSSAVVSTFVFGTPGDMPVAGDWDHDGRDTAGVFRRGTWFVTNGLAGGPAHSFTFGGDPADVAVTWG